MSKNNRPPLSVARLVRFNLFLALLSYAQDEL